LSVSKPKIAIVSNTAWNIVNFRLPLLHALKDNGYEPVAIAPSDEYSARIEAEGFRFIALKNLERKGTGPIKDLKLLFELRQIYRREHIALALHYTIKPNIYGSFAAGLSNCSSVSTVTGLGYSFLSKNWVSSLAKMLYKYAFRQANAIAFQNDDDRNLFIETKLVRKEKTLLIRGSGVDCSYFKPLEKTKAAEKLVFLFVGRLLFDKGIKEYLYAAEKIKTIFPQTEFQIVGKLDSDNPSCISNAELEKALQQNIVAYLGATDQVREFIRNADCVVLPSYREGLPRVMLEAISMAKPIVTTDAAGCRDTIMDGKNGFMAESRSNESLYEAIKKICECSKATLEVMGNEGRELALREFDEKIVIDKYLQLIGNILRPNNS
jgi:glycosyltransferase involved in cell wall biosynthesis